MASQAFKTLHLYTTPLSGCSARIRIASYLKGITLTHHSISIAEAQNRRPDYLAINPNGSLPSLVVEASDNFSSPEKLAITQSPAILDFLETNFPSPPLLPPTSQVAQRARVLELTSLVACDIQPPQNSRIRQKIIDDFRGDGEKWAKYVYERGFGVYEEFLSRGEKGRYSVGNEPTFADVFLIPAVQGGLRVGVELGKWPLMKNVVDACWELEAFRKGGLGEHGRLTP
ncbi:hypothetical protein ONS95_004868 [Cadophora gregata]|uniref:uncharacterized protein n=1 Tax=Cadophora gregata TaxID=51156 RepID=UPI0026DD9832|nr:uncharacterized protein ONS95_004868 [Cadophora gregata]KAK0104582.1 hypothetical protein ONS95_004868 [Cadophora gregata]KAK0115330.1 hypothetical protein ONS96_013789 [Cadophora gregata f. sp. sojae]